MDLSLELVEAVLELDGDAAQLVRVDAHPCPFHFRQDRHQRPLEGFVDRVQSVRNQGRTKHASKPESDIGVFRRVRARSFDRDLRKCPRLAAGADERLDGLRLMAEMPRRKVIKPVPVQPRMQHIGHEHGVIDRRHVDPVAGQYL